MGKYDLLLKMYVFIMELLNKLYYVRLFSIFGRANLFFTLRNPGTNTEVYNNFVTKKLFVQVF